jgi:hypothetical protein
VEAHRGKVSGEVLSVIHPTNADWVMGNSPHGSDWGQSLYSYPQQVNPRMPTSRHKKAQTQLALPRGRADYLIEIR